jgi:hypothetical protein
MAGSDPKANWVERIFDAKAAQNYGVVRRKVANVDKYASEMHLFNAVKDRGFHLLKCGEQYIVLCNRAPLDVIRKGKMQIIERKAAAGS